MDAQTALALTKKTYRRLAARRPEIEMLDAYYEGDQPLVYASKEWADWHRDRYVGFSDNWCGVVANSPAERLRVNGIRMPKGQGVTKRAKRLWDDWLRNDGDAQSSQGLLESIIAKRSAVIVWGDEDDEPEFTWEHPAQVYILHDEVNPRRKIAMLKAWVEGDDEYATLYTPDAVWKWQRKLGVKVSGGVTANGLTVIGTSFRASDDGPEWEPRQPPSDDTWPISNPLGEVPGVEYPNRPRLARQALSDIQGTKAMQDAINLLWAYLFGAADHASFPGRVIMGQEPPKMPILDDRGQQIGEKPIDIKELAHGRFLWLTGQSTKIDQWDAAKLDVFTGVIEIALGHIAAQTRTPPHYLVTNKGLSNLSGDALVAAETGLVKKVEEDQLFLSASVREHFRLMALVRGDTKLADALRMASVDWADPAMRSDAQLADALLKKREIGYPFEYILELDGLGPRDIERVMEMKRAEADDPMLDKISAQLGPYPMSDNEPDDGNPAAS